MSGEQGFTDITDRLADVARAEGKLLMKNAALRWAVRHREALTPVLIDSLILSLEQCEGE